MNSSSICINKRLLSSKDVREMVFQVVTSIRGTKRPTTVRIFNWFTHTVVGKREKRALKHAVSYDPYEIMEIIGQIEERLGLDLIGLSEDENQVLQKPTIKDIVKIFKIHLQKAGRLRAT